MKTTLFEKITKSKSFSIINGMWLNGLTNAFCKKKKYRKKKENIQQEDSASTLFCFGVMTVYCNT